MAMVRRYAALAACALPAVGIGVRTKTHDVIASFVYACPGSGVAPTVRVRYADARRLAPRPASSPVGLYEGGRKPASAYRVIGEIELVLHDNDTGFDTAERRAKQEARRMGGDAIVDWRWDDAAKARPPAGEQGRLCFRGSVIRFL